MTPTPCIYRIDASYRIVAVGGSWAEFALANGGDNLLPDDVLGRPLWEFVTDDNTRHLYRMLIDRVVHTRVAVSIPFRCDSPDKRRFMQMSIAPHATALCEFTSRMVRVETRPPQVLLADQERPRMGTIRICSWCKSVEVAASRWEEIEEAARQMEFFAAASLPFVTHTICPKCNERITGQLNEPLPPTAPEPDPRPID
ncbi:MAG: PAS domain-containing protein [Lentisphaerae bacterium]|nr:PAS domain-containing protein [Lentisphaerota bacterium]